MQVKLYDNTRLAASKTCYRYYYFRHVLHWVHDTPSEPLVFGASWHSAMEVIWELMCQGIDDVHQIVDEAHHAFLSKWKEQGANPELSYEEEQAWAPRTPSRAYEMLVEYVNKRLVYIEDMQLLAVERPFVVPLDAEQKLYYCGKIDKVVARRGKILGIEHKTTTAYKRDGGFRNSFLDSFSPNSQVDGYLYALHMNYEPGEVGGVWIDAALVHKTEEAFTYIPIEKQIEHLDAWLWETRHWIQKIEEEKERLALVTPEDKYMAAFPKNTNSCFNYNRACMYLDVCKAWPNPLGRERPSNMVEEPWDPLKEIPGVAQVLGQLTGEVSDGGTAPS